MKLVIENKASAEVFSFSYYYLLDVRISVIYGAFYGMLVDFKRTKIVINPS